MKKLLLLVAITTIALPSFCQVPEGFKYQAVIRGASSLILTDQPVGIQLMIRQGSAGGPAVYTETFLPTTNGYGLVNLEIGTGATSDDFTTIDWANGPYFMETAVDVTGGVAYQVMGTSQLMSVPYALYAKTAENVTNDAVNDADADPNNELQAISFSNDTLYLSNGGQIYLGAYGVDLVDDADNDPTNEIETWGTLSGIPTDIADGDNVNDADADPNNELQAISFSNDTLYLSNGGQIYLGAYGVDLVDDADNDPTNEIETWGTLSGIPTDIADGDNVNDADADPNNEIQTISLSGSNLSISSGNAVNLSGIDTDDQTLSFSGGILTISEGNSANLNGLSDHDWYVENTTNTPTSVNHNIYTHGNVGIGASNPASKVEVVGDVRLNGNNAGIIYENKETNEDWRLVYSDNFESNVEGWIANQALSTGDLGMTRQSMNVAGLVGHFVRPNNNNHVLKKYFDLSGLSYSEVKVEFNYLFLDSWDNEIAWLGVMGSESGNPTPIWNKRYGHDDADMELNGTTYNISFYGNGSWSDNKHKAQAQFSWSGGGFWIEFGANLDGDVADETFGVDNVMIYVR